MSDEKTFIKEHLKTSVKSINTTAVPQHSFPLVSSESKNNALDETSPTYAEIPVKSFYGTSNIDKQIMKPKRAAIEASSKMRMKRTVPNCRHRRLRAMPRQPMLGRINASKLKTEKVKLSSSVASQPLLLENIKIKINNARANGKMNLQNLNPNNSDKKQIVGELLIEKFKIKVDLAKLETSLFSDDKNQKEGGDGVKERDKINEILSATEERGHGSKSLSPPRNIDKKMKTEALRSCSNESFDIVAQRSNNPNTVDGNDLHFTPPRYKVKKQNEGYDGLLSSFNDVFDDDKKDSKNIEKVEDKLKSDDDDDMVISENISKLYDKYRNMIPYNTTDSYVIRRQQTVLGLLIQCGICNDENFKICVAEYDQHKDKAAEILNNLLETSILSHLQKENDTTSLTSQKDPVTKEQALSVYIANDLMLDIQDSKMEPPFDPNFYREHLRIDTKKDVAVPFANKLFKAIPASYNPIQISASQKEFGLKTCSQCEMIYMPNDAEDDMLHTNFHNNMLRVLTIHGWKHENLIDKVKEWGNMGRIIWLNHTDVESRLMKMKEILAIVDKDLGFAIVNLPPDSIIYLAISRKLIIGVCVAEHLKQAHLMSTENQVEYIDTKTDIPVKCGISRIWVTPQYRRCGVATRLMQAVCSQFEHGHILSVSEIAFGTPTVMCKSFAQKFAGKIFVYDPIAT